ncbi:sulfiredoxin [Hanseniaspora valbyensis NRRL Y-1626]|uniref:Sulfiredoxin n=1 Tax=Hanseniaspora valbyensis NRRL Y-1626 TaxID=766949 RepID=A0A1B7TGE2_9ASCO|nr:sulfiredoxin [Hanseniaspora valbyensis NRRL Y-1626]
MSFQSGNNKNIDYIPINDIKRPIQPDLDLQKVESMISTLKGVPMASRTCTLEQASESKGELPALDVFLIVKREQDANNNLVKKNYYFSFASCHRLTAYSKLQEENPNEVIKAKCKVYPTTEQQLKLYLGASAINI